MQSRRFRPKGRFRPKKELEIVSLIDVIFMLIIFGLVISISGGATKFEGPPLENLYSIVIKRAPVSEELQGQVQSDRLMVEFFDENHRRIGDTASFPPDESEYWLDSDQFDNLRPCLLIREELGKLAAQLGAAGVNEITEKVEIHVEVTHDTKSRIVNYISQQCAQYQDKICWIRLSSR